MKLRDLTEEQIERAKACKTEEEIQAFLSENQIELTPEELEQISGGSWSIKDLWPKIKKWICGEK